MKKIPTVLSIIILMSLIGCASGTKFPSSAVVPAANITAQKKTDKQNNFSLEITAKNLASAERLTPPANYYSVWIVSKKYGIKNVGQILIENAKKNTFMTSTPYDFDEVFITAEKVSDNLYPMGVEIVRTKL